MKVMLLFPPAWTPTMPHLALPALTAYLRSHGVEVIQRDLNIETFDEILTHAYLAQAVDRLRQNYRAHSARWPVDQRAWSEWALAHGSQLAAQIEDAKSVVRSDAFLDGPTGLHAFQVMVQSLEAASLPFYPAALDLSTYSPPAPVDRSTSLLQAVRDPRHNMFLDIFRRGVIADFERERPDIVGISIPTLEQMLAGMTLAYLIKETGLPCHVTVGGPHVSMLREQIPQVPSLFDLFDSAVVFEGEKPLLRLVEALDGDGDLSKVPNLIYRDGGRGGHASQIRTTPCEEPERIVDLPLPDFEGLPLDRYLAPSLVLPLLTSHGCYHGRCAFCNVGYGGSNSFHQLPAERVVEGMMALHDEHGVRHIFFADEAITPRNLDHMSSLLEELGAPIHWCGCVRFEKALTRELLEGMARGGCLMLLFGLETASEPMIQRMDKGTQREQMGRILRDGAAAGIWNHLFFFFGFPGETIGHAQETVNFVYEHKQAVHSASPGAFILMRHAPVYCDPAQYGIKRIVQDPGRDLAIHFDYEVESGMDEATAELVASRFLDTLPEKRFGHYYMNDVHRFLYVSDLRDRGAALPLWLVPEGAGRSQQA